MTDHARVVVIGGGNMGTSVLYHLAREGWNDTVLIEKAQLTSGATWHAAGLVSRMVGSHSLGCLHDYAVDLYQSIERETGVCVSWHGCGSMRVATSKEHLDWIRHLKDTVTSRGQVAELLSPAQVAELNPLYDIEAAGILAALYTPDDGHVDPSGTCQAMARGARQRGARIMLDNRVLDVSQHPSGDWVVETEQGIVRCQHVVNAGGYHARQIGKFSGLDLPITTILHHYTVTDTVPILEQAAHEIPVTRDDYFYGYLRQEQKSVLIGLYDKHQPKVVWPDGCPWNSKNELFELNLENSFEYLEKCFERLPALTNLGIKSTVNGGITYTPDGAMLLGPAPGLQNYWLACGATAGIAWGPGAGRSLAQWMIHGSADISMRAFDPRRFGDWANADYARARSVEDYSIRHNQLFPQHQRRVMRNIKQSGAHAKTAALGATFEEAGGWERPRVYAAEPLSWRRSRIHQQIGDECRCVRQRLGLGDFSAFAKFEITGSDSEAFLNRVCANQIPSKVGATCLTLLLNPRGTIEGEATVAKTADNRFYMVTGAPSQRRVWDWLNLHQRGRERISLQDRTDELGVLTLAGPEARNVLETLTDCDLSSSNFPWLTARHLTVADLAVTALRLSFTGELAYELHTANDRLDELWTALWQAGRNWGMGVFGSKAIDSMRMEKFYRGGHELTNDVTPKEAGLMRFVKLDKPFTGKQALQEHNADSRCVLLALENSSTECLSGEAVFVNGELSGSVTSAAYGHTIEKSLAMGFIKSAALSDTSVIEVSLLGKKVRATHLQQAPYDPQNERLKI